MRTLVLLLVVAATLAGCSSGTAPSSSASGPTTHAPVDAKLCKNAPRLAAGAAPVAVVETTMGTIRVDLTPDKAPVTVANFVCLARIGFFDGLSFHRIISDFMMQGGDPQGTGSGGPGYSIPDEFTPTLRFDHPGVLAMANAGPNTGGSQFFITFVATPWLNDHHSIFGQAEAQTMDVVQKVNTEAGSSSGAPRVPVRMTSVRILLGGEEMPFFTPAPGTASPTPSPTPAPTTTQPIMPAGTVALDAITPGTWALGGSTDRMLVWVQNQGPTVLTVTPTLTGANGEALPQGWSVSFTPPTLTLQPAGTRTAHRAPDWGYVVANLTIPAAAQAGPVALELHASNATRTLAATVAAHLGATAGPGTRVTVHYDGHFNATGARFDEGDFPTTLGSGQTVPGFDNGIMGLTLNETQRLVVPPALAYGYDNPPGRYAAFNGQWLDFIVTVREMSAA